MTKCDLCGDESAILYTVENPKSDKQKEYHLCENCLKIVHEAFVEIR